MAKAPEFVVHVTQSIIDKAMPKNARRCIIAEALRQCLRAESITVDTSLIRFNRDGMRYFYPTPIRAALIAQTYDEGKKVIPFSFRLGKNGATAPKAKRGPILAARKKKPRRVKPVGKRCIRRYRGIRIIKALAA
jgi:hypothetical protein